jgi:lipoate-protein ligase A
VQYNAKSMKYLDLSLKTPAENLALDEALLEEAETSGTETLRFWESLKPFVVLGYSNAIKTEVFEDYCALKKIPILRRASGGGTVLQGPGCLNYALILRQDRHPDLKSMIKTNSFIMSKIADGLTSILRNREIQVCGYTDLAFSNLKFSGNAQRRKKDTLLFHGTFLIDFDLDLISKVLRMPSKEPEYRENRAHFEFVQNLKELNRQELKDVMRKIWSAQEAILDYPKEIVKNLVLTKYTTKEWNDKF